MKYKLWSLLLVCMASVLAVSAMAAGSAYAIEGTRGICEETAIKGQGSSLQGVAQGLWITGSKCKVTYESTGSGAGRKAWGIEDEGAGNTPHKSGYEFIASDEPLNAKQIKELDEASDGETQAIVIPVEQAAVAVIAHPPVGCTINEITNKELKEVLNTQVTRWLALPKASPRTAGGACDALIKRVVRKDVSGTTYVFKTYLKEIENETCSKTKWSEYREPTKNLEWPEPGQGTCAGTKAIVAKNSGGSGEVEEVVNTTGAIGYANLADARKQYKAGGSYHWLAVENESNKKFEEPGNSEGEPSVTPAESNCKETAYGTIPAYGANDNWSEVNGAHPKGGNKHYSICTLTYDIALGNYKLAGLTEANLGLAAMQYLEYVVSKEGQEAIKGHDYLKVEEAVGNRAKEEAALVNLREL